ncbi:MAG TPA: hypothetical protein VG246_13190 [Acidimicrobiales bacterium]|nr:hypothetical protein [Acidimicrobiales bacterium]
MHWLNSLWWWVEVHTGTVNEGGPYYGFWSGFGSDISELGSVLGLFVLYYRHNNCHTPGCRFIGHHGFADANGVTYKLCHRCIKKIPKREDIQ